MFRPSTVFLDSLGDPGREKEETEGSFWFPAPTGPSWSEWVLVPALVLDRGRETKDFSRDTKVQKGPRRPEGRGVEPQCLP